MERKVWEMPVTTYRWPAVREFRDRRVELDQLDRWWASTAREPLSLYGRRRVGKSWLFRRFAHGKPAVILVADRVAAGQQLTHLAAELEPVLGLRPHLADVADLFRLLYQLGARRKVLVVVDEFPYLLGTTSAEQQGNLTAIQAVMEQHRDSSKLKLVLTGSAVAMMEALGAERSPMHGRLVPLTLWPMPFGDATLLMDVDDPLEQLTRYSIAGGMPRYLAALRGPDLTVTLATSVVSRYGQLFNEPRTLLQTELREPAVYFSVLSELAGNPQDVAAIAAALRMEANQLGPYLAGLEALRLVARRRPAGADAHSRGSQWRCTDHFVRFWFRFVAPYQSELEAGADPVEHVERNVLPALNEHTAPAFEDALTSWMRTAHPGATSVGVWWGRSLHRLRAAKERFTEEVDAVALHGRTVTAVAEAKWTNKPLDAAVLRDLLDFKLPALAQDGFSTTGAQIVLASRSGFTEGARTLAADTPAVRLLDASVLLSDLRSGTVTPG